MAGKIRLRIGAIMHFLIALGHIACLFFLEEAFKAYGILDTMLRLCFYQKWMLYVVTVSIALSFVMAGLYALSASGDIRKLPLQRLFIIVIIAMYSIRTIIGASWLVSEFSSLQFFSTLIPALIIYCYLPALKREV